MSHVETPLPAVDAGCEPAPVAQTLHRPVALVTGVGRTVGIGAGLAVGLAEAGWDVAFTYWDAYDRRMPWGAEPSATRTIADRCRAHGADTLAVETDLAAPEAPARLLDDTERGLGPVTALVIAHCEGVESGLFDTTVESFDRHLAVNTRATWLLVTEYAERFAGPHGSGRIVSVTSDHTAHNLPYGTSKGAMDRIVLAAARELAGRGITANVVNPGGVDTGWMTEDVREHVIAGTPLGRLGTPRDTAHLVRFLCSPEGGWINGQLIKSNGGWDA